MGKGRVGGMSAFDDLLARVTGDGDGRFAADIPAGWMQGRTAYGGISAALALHVARLSHPTDKPLRSAQISFVGPVGGACAVHCTSVRESKSSLFVVADVAGESGLGTHALFSFSRGRASHLDHDRMACPAVPAPEMLEPLPPHPMRPAFTRHFDMRPADGPRLLTGQDSADMLVWVRYIDTPACDAVVALLALADALPPAALMLQREFGPISTMSWTVHMLTDAPQTDDGWWLLRSTTDHARSGFSPQIMTIWNRAGDVIATGGQGVALYS